MALVIVLNGTSSAGKSSLARAVQQLAARAFLHVEMDAFLSMQAARLNNHPDGFVFRLVPDAAPPEISIETGAYGARLLDGMRRSVAALADAGLDVIVDDVWLGLNEQAAYAGVLPSHDVRFVGVHASLDACEAREKARGDRDVGQVRWQFNRVHQGTRYDLELDTSERTPQEAAQTLVEAFGL